MTETKRKTEPQPSTRFRKPVTGGSHEKEIGWFVPMSKRRFLITITCLLAATPFARAGKFGSFTNSDDVGAPPLKGSVEFDASTEQYKITGSGTDIWGRADQFHFVWREMSDNFSVTATAKFLTEGIGHRKAVIMLRKSLDPDSPFLHLAIHGDGMPSVQFRNTKADNVNTVNFPTEGPGVWKLKLVRQGPTITFWISKDGAPLEELGHTTKNQLGSPIFVGLGVASHTQRAVNTVLFSDVSVEQLPQPAPIKSNELSAIRRLPPVSTSAFAQSGTLGIFTRSGDVGSPAIKGGTKFSNGQYQITGSGANIWGKQDQFQYVWREMTGNFVVTATMRFLGRGSEHRKGGIMVRQSLDPDAAYADVVIHGSGMPALQWRRKQGEDTNTFDLPFDKPGTFNVKLVRSGVKIYMYVGKDGAEPKKIANTEVSFQGPVLVGLAVCAHQADAKDTALFSNVSVEAQAPPAPVSAGTVAPN